MKANINIVLANFLLCKAFKAQWCESACKAIATIRNIGKPLVHLLRLIQLCREMK